MQSDGQKGATMKRFLSCVLVAGVGVFYSLRAAEAPCPDNSQQQIRVAVRLLELSPGNVKELFGKKGAAPGRDVTEDIQQRLGGLKTAEVLVAPRFITCSGKSAQIKICKEMSFVTNFRVVETNGAWEPVTQTVDVGTLITIVASPYPHDPERLRGSAEITLSQVDSVGEQTVTPPGSQSPIKLQSPVISTRTLTASFDMDSGDTIILGSLQPLEEEDAGKSIIVLMQADLLNTSADLIAKLESRMIPDINFEHTPLGEVISWLSDQLRNAGITFALSHNGGTLTAAKISLSNVKDADPGITLVAHEMSLYDFLCYLAKIENITVTFDKNRVTLMFPH